MKNIRDFIAADMWEHVNMTGPAILDYSTGRGYSSLSEKKEYCEGMLTVFPYTLLRNFTKWYWDDDPPREYAPLMESGVAALRERLSSPLKQAFDPCVKEEVRGEILIPLIAEVIPAIVITDYHDYMFSEVTSKKDIHEFLESAKPLLTMTKEVLQLAY